MNVINLIQELELLQENFNPLCASIGVDSEKYYLDIFGNSKGIPYITLAKDEQLSAKKNVKSLLKELNVWILSSVHYHLDSDVFLTTLHEYSDESYDFRYFRLTSVFYNNESIVLVAESKECVEFREHFEALDTNCLT